MWMVLGAAVMRMMARVMCVGLGGQGTLHVVQLEGREIATTMHAIVLVQAADVILFRFNILIVGRNRTVIT